MSAARRANRRALRASESRPSRGPYATGDDRVTTMIGALALFAVIASSEPRVDLVTIGMGDGVADAFGDCAIRIDDVAYPLDEPSLPFTAFIERASKADRTVRTRW